MYTGCPGVPYPAALIGRCAVPPYSAATPSRGPCHAEPVTATSPLTGRRSKPSCGPRQPPFDCAVAAIGTRVSVMSSAATGAPARTSFDCTCKGGVHPPLAGCSCHAPLAAVLRAACPPFSGCSWHARLAPALYGDTAGLQLAGRGPGGTLWVAL
eukprot:362063-Chlamydomonas_euryale.AAC.6